MMLRLTASVSALALGLFAVAPAQADQLLPQGRINSDNDILFGALKLGKRQSGKTTLTPDALQIQGEGSSGPISGMSVKPAGALLAVELSTLFADAPPVASLGIDMTGTADSTAALANAINSGKRIVAPCGTIRVTDTIRITKASARFEGAGDCTVLKYDAPAGTPAKPLIDILPSAVGADLSKFSFDHQGQLYTVSTTYDGLAGGVAVMIQADSSRLRDITGRNGFDNCFMAVAWDSSNHAIRGKPQYYSLDNIRTFNCGRGPAATGAGIDIGSGSAGTVNNLVDDGSYAAFILDIGAGANGTFSNLVGYNTKFNGTVPSYTFYIGEAGSTFTNLQSIGAGHTAMWLDGYAYRTTISNVNIKAPARDGILIKGGNSVLTNVVVNSPGYGGPANTYDAVVIDTSAASIDNLLINGLSIQNEFATPRYGINKTYSNGLTGAALNASLGAAAAATNNIPGTFGVVDGQALGGGWTPYTPTISCASGSLTASSANGSYRRMGKTVEVQANLTLTTIGTCSGAITASLPLPVVTRVAFSGVESNNSGVGLVGAAYEASSAVLIKRYDGTSPVAAGAILSVSGSYQTP
ncbi:hypothetical protein [Methylobacterium sp. ID0610]|uniref:hypothetical protein n=1 Tax=Methylobacterium carpenticola TaxID=3344827 RepID=UPI0036CCE7CD